MNGKQERSKEHEIVEVRKLRNRLVLARTVLTEITVDEWNDRNSHRLVELLKRERECIERNELGECDRKCEGCDLVCDTHELLEMYDYLIARYEK